MTGRPATTDGSPAIVAVTVCELSEPSSFVSVAGVAVRFTTCTVTHPCAVSESPRTSLPAAVTQIVWLPGVRSCAVVA